jgi:hypothetical protein
MALDCRHKPPCPAKATRFACGQRTAFEECVKRGLVDRQAAERILAKYGVPMTPPSKVYRGESQVHEVQEPLFAKKFS